MQTISISSNAARSRAAQLIRQQAAIHALNEIRFIAPVLSKDGTLYFI
jgi:acyl dehydratase